MKRKIKKKTNVNKNKNSQVNKKPKKRRCNYDKEQLKKAVEEAKKGVSTTELSILYNIPEATIRARRDGRYSDKGPGPDPTLKEVENDLVNWILYCFEKGRPVTKKQVLDSVQIMCINGAIPNTFKNNRPGRKWFTSFMKRHPNLSQRVPENISSSRANVTEPAIKSLFQEIKDYFSENDVLNIDASRIFNTDETPIQLNPKPESVLAEIGAKDIQNQVDYDEKTSVTLLVTGNAAGKLAPPFILFAGKKMPKDVIRMGPEDFGFGFSDNGWMTAKTFYEFIANIFHPWLVKENIKFPVILYVDKHSSHVTLPLRMFCKENKIILTA